MILAFKPSYFSNIIKSIGILPLLFVSVSSGETTGPTKVSFLPDGVMLMDGQPVFPIGVTMPPPPDGKTPEGTAAYAELRSGGVGFMRTGPMAEPWNDDAINKEQAYEDAAAKYGLHCLCWLREFAGIKPGDTAREAKLKAIVDRFKNHPGLAIWKGEDEPEWGKKPIPPLVHVRELLKQMDPNHPVWIVQAPRGTVESRAKYDPTYDVTGMDIYPVSYPPGGHSLLPNKEISMVGDYTREMMEVAANKKPVWMTLQIAWSGVTKEGKTLRFPTFPQERFMTYQAIINGARGLIYFGGNLLTDCTPADAELGWNWTFWKKILRPVLEEVNDKGPLKDALIAPNSQLPIHLDGAKDIEFCVREAGDDIYLLACKREGETVKATFTGLPKSITDSEVLFESPRHVQVANGSFTDWFGPFEVHVYHFKK